MILDGKDLGLGKVVITDSSCRFYNKDNQDEYREVHTKCIDVYDKNHDYRFNFWTICEYKDFNKLELNKKTSIMDMIDNYDIDFAAKDGHIFTINSEENSEVYFTKLEEDKYKLEAKINDFTEAVMGQNTKYKNMSLEAIVDFNE